MNARLVEHFNSILFSCFLSFSSILQVAKKLNNNKELGTLEMGVFYSKIPDTIKKEVIDPYISIEHNEARISLRIKDSEKNLRRNDLIKKINFDLKNKIGLEEDEYKLMNFVKSKKKIYKRIF